MHTVRISAKGVQAGDALIIHVKNALKVVMEEFWKERGIRRNRTGNRR